MRKYGLLVAFLAVGLHLDAQQGAKLDTTSFIVVGEGLAAGMADFSLREVYQKNSFPAVMARQREDLGPLTADPRWQTPAPVPGAAPWTDQYSNLLGALLWQSAPD